MVPLRRKSALAASQRIRAAAQAENERDVSPPPSPVTSPSHDDNGEDEDDDDGIVDGGGGFDDGSISPTSVVRLNDGTEDTTSTPTIQDQKAGIAKKKEMGTAKKQSTSDTDCGDFDDDEEEGEIEEEEDDDGLNEEGPSVAHKLSGPGKSSGFSRTKSKGELDDDGIHDDDEDDEDDDDQDDECRDDIQTKANPKTKRATTGGTSQKMKRSKTSAGNGTSPFTTGKAGNATATILNIIVARKVKFGTATAKRYLPVYTGISGASTIRNGLAHLKKRGLITVAKNGDISPTAHGMDSADANAIDLDAIPSTNRAYHALVIASKQLSTNEIKIFDHISNGNVYLKEDVRKALQYGTNSTWRNLVAGLKKKEVLEYHPNDKSVRLVRDIFPFDAQDDE